MDATVNLPVKLQRRLEDAFERQHMELKRHAERQHKGLCLLLEGTSQNLRAELFELVAEACSELRAAPEEVANTDFEEEQMCDTDLASNGKLNILSKAAFASEASKSIYVSEASESPEQEENSVVEETDLARTGDSAQPSSGNHLLQRSGSAIGDKKIRRNSTLNKLKLQELLSKDTSVMARVKKFVRGPFDLIMGVIITLNAVVMFMQTMQEGARAGIALSNSNVSYADTVWSGSDFWFDASEHLFMVIYISECAFRILVLRSNFFYDREMGEGVMYSNLFDASIVLLGILDLYLLPFVSREDVVDEQQGASPLPLAKMLRLLKVARALRIIRVVKLFRQLRVLTTTIVASVGALFWSMVLLLLLNVVGGMVLCQLLQSYILDPEKDHEMRKWVYDHYGDSARAMYTMYEVTNSGCWPNYSRPLMEEVSPWFAIFYMVYVTIVVFAIIRIISALFLKETLQVASNDAVIMVQERLREKVHFKEKLSMIFEEADASGDGMITRDEFEAILKNEHVASFFSILDLEVRDAHSLFDLLDDGTGQVTYEEFLSGCLRLKGQARSQDVITILHESHKLERKTHILETRLDEVIENVRRLRSPSKIPIRAPSKPPSKFPATSMEPRKFPRDERVTSNDPLRL